MADCWYGTPLSLLSCHGNCGSHVLKRYRHKMEKDLIPESPDGGQPPRTHHQTLGEWAISHCAKVLIIQGLSNCSCYWLLALMWDFFVLLLGSSSSGPLNILFELKCESAYSSKMYTLENKGSYIITNNQFSVSFTCILLNVILYWLFGRANTARFIIIIMFLLKSLSDNQDKKVEIGTLNSELPNDSFSESWYTGMLKIRHSTLKVFCGLFWRKLSIQYKNVDVLIAREGRQRERLILFPVLHYYSSWPYLFYSMKFKMNH